MWTSPLYLIIDFCESFDEVKFIMIFKGSFPRWLKVTVTHYFSPYAASKPLRSIFPFTQSDGILLSSAEFHLIHSSVAVKNQLFN